MNNKKITILITNFNKEKYIEKCILSCLNQDYKNLEIIIFDNESSDNSDEIIKKYSDKLIYKRKKRISGFSPKNQIDILIEGFKISSGEIVCLLDGDDFFFPEKINKIDGIFKQNPNLDVIFDTPYIDKNKKLVPLKIKKKMNKYIWPTIIPTSGISLRRSFFEKCIKFDLFKDFNMIEIDLRINFYSQKIKQNYKICYDCLTFYRQVNDGIMSKIKTYSYKWWCKRLDAHNFIEKIYKSQNIFYKKNLDYYFTRLFVGVLKKFY